MDVSANVFHGMVNNLMEEFCVESLISRERFAVQSGACCDVGFNQSMESIAFAVGNHYLMAPPNPPIAEEFWEIWVSPQGN